jgi:hypothetical protein
MKKTAREAARSAARIPRARRSPALPMLARLPRLARQITDGIRRLKSKQSVESLAELCRNVSALHRATHTPELAQAVAQL